VITGFSGWAAFRSNRLRAVQSGTRLSVLLALLAISSLALAKPPRRAAQALRSTSLTFTLKDGSCLDGPIAKITPKSVTIQPPGRPAEAVARDDLRQASQNGSILFSARSSWADVEGVHLMSRESFVIKLRTGKTVKGKPYHIEDKAIVFKHGWWPKKVYPKSDLVTIDYLRVKPDAFGFDYFTQEAPALLFFYPEFYDQLKGLEGRVPVRLYDAVQHEDNSPLPCARP
jgi:hypothetical protein